ncbi:MAG: 50S ribosomal protein L3 [Puniceicoccales bacterium]|jgi:large subunit ribosomal protein L3|nr:50S ribosomal protein L3 [Puniceicoccales bacterium]
MEKKIILLMGRKLGMTQLQEASGRLVAATAIEVEPCPIVCLRTEEENGYRAVQVAAQERKVTGLTAAEVGHCAHRQCKPHARLRELRVRDLEPYRAGEVFSLEDLSVGDLVDVAGTSKGHGFQGVMKRHGFAGGPASHGSMFHRRGGSYGQREEPGRIYPGRKMPGHMGVRRRTVQNLAVVRILPEQHLLFLRGSVAGANGGWVTVRSAKKGS